MMKPTARVAGSESLTDDVMNLLLDLAEEAILDVESRTDEPCRRLDTSDIEASEIADLRLAVAELYDSFPGMHYELETVGDRLRNVGAFAATRELEIHSHIIHLVRLSLEVLFRQFSTVEAYESGNRRDDDVGDEEMQSPAERYEAYRHLAATLRRRLS